MENLDPATKLKFRTQRKYNSIIKKCRLSIKQDKCNACLECVKFCPASNITNEDDKLKFGKNCVACMRCLNFCKQDAIAYAKKPLLKYAGPYEKFAPADIYKKR